MCYLRMIIGMFGTLIVIISIIHRLESCFVFKGNKVNKLMKSRLILLVFLTISILNIGCAKEEVVQNTEIVEIEETDKVISTEEPTPSEQQEQYLITVTQDELQQKIDIEEDLWVYVGRPNCKDCQAYYPKLKEYLTQVDDRILYFNTRVKTSKKEAMVTFLGENGVDEIPAIMHWINGRLERIYDMQTEEDIDDFENDFKR